MVKKVKKVAAYTMFAGLVLLALVVAFPLRLFIRSTDGLSRLFAAMSKAGGTAKSRVHKPFRAASNWILKLTICLLIASTGCTTVRVQKGGPVYQVCRVYHLQELINMTRKESRMVFVCQEVDERQAKETMR